jgi:UDP-2,3-diacylglucosamine pyrophosphatase LpxH
MTWEEKIKIYDEIVATCPRFDRKGKTVPYTSANGHMFSFFNKAEEFGIRFSKEDQEKFMEKYNTTLFMSHGTVMKGYVLVPETMMEDADLIAISQQKL